MSLGLGLVLYGPSLVSSLHCFRFSALVFELCVIPDPSPSSVMTRPGCSHAGLLMLYGARV